MRRRGSRRVPRRIAPSRRAAARSFHRKRRRAQAALCAVFSLSLGSLRPLVRRGAARGFGLADARVILLGYVVRVFVDIPHAGIARVFGVLGDAVWVAVMLNG